MKVFLMMLALPALLLPALCLLYIIIQALPALNWALIVGGHADNSSNMSVVGQSLWHQISGSLFMMLLANVVAAPIALSISLFHALILSPRHQVLLMTILQVLQGIPPIVYGLCGLVLLVHLLHWGISLAAGAVILAVIVLPLLSSNMIHALERIPLEQTQAAASLGLNSVDIIWRVWLPMAWRSMLTGLLLAMARSLSETAPILFTATVFSGIVWPDSLFSPVTSLQTHIFYLAQEGSTQQSMHIAWASATVLLSLVLLFSLSGLWLRRYKDKL